MGGPLILKVKTLVFVAQNVNFNERKSFRSQHNHYRTFLSLVKITLVETQIYYHICVTHKIYLLAKQFVTMLCDLDRSTFEQCVSVLKITLPTLFKFHRIYFKVSIGYTSSSAAKS